MVRARPRRCRSVTAACHAPRLTAAYHGPTVATVPDPVIVRLYVRPRLRAAGSRLLVPGWLAITIGTTIVSWRRLEPDELTHELTHVRQWRRYGSAGYVVRYLASSLWAWSHGMDWYRDNTFERAARRAALDRTGTTRGGAGRPTARRSQATRNRFVPHCSTRSTPPARTLCR